MHLPVNTYIGKNEMKHILNAALLILFINCAVIDNCVAQKILQKKITISITQKPLSDVLASIEKQGNFFFSYNSNLFNADSIVTVNAKKQSVSSVLHTLFDNRFQYHEQNNHLIITQAASQNILEITGTITDRVTGEPVPYATVYERNQLVAAMTDEQGSFRLNLKKRSSTDSISVSRVSYADTIMPLRENQSGDIKIAITVINKPLDSVIISMMQRDWLKRSILSSRQIINSLNLDNFFAKQSFQFSVLPGIGTHGQMSSQLVNKFSFNLLGGYNGGVNGVEIAGLYNITNKNVRSVQIAGLFNIVGGHADGFQVAGLFNRDLSVNGFQAAGIFNKIAKAEGFQVAGLFNKDSSMRGFQAAGIYNKTKKTEGFQAAVFNKNDTMHGFQAGVVNRNHRFKGIQIGLINAADTIEGIPIGLINLGKSGIQHVSFSYNETGLLFLSYKSGNPNFYNILVAGSTLNFNEKAFSIGYGFGHKMNLTNTVSVNPELTVSYLYNGNKEKQNIATRLQLNLQFNISKSFSLYAGPAITTLYSKPGIIPGGYKTDLSNGAHNFSVAKNTIGWFGWNVGINIF